MSDDEKTPTRTKGEGGLFQIKHSRNWYIKVGGVRESTGTTNRKAALKVLQKRLSDLAAGLPTGPAIDRTTFAELAVMIVTDYTVNKRKTLGRVEESLAHLRAAFGGVEGKAKAITITADRITTYTKDRQDEGAANATINRELACLKRMFRLGERAQKVGRRPYIAMLKENNTRKGFFEPEQFRAVVAHLPEDVRAIAQVAYITGWRVTDELKTRQWQHVDFNGGWLRLEPGETKNDEGRMFPLTPELRQVLEQQRARTTALEQSQDRIVPWVFWRVKGPGVLRTARLFGPSGGPG